LFFESERLAIVLPAIELFIEAFDDRFIDVALTADILIDVKPVADEFIDVLFMKDVFVDELFAA
jgi:hypothetical protein